MYIHTYAHTNPKPASDGAPAHGDAPGAVLDQLEAHEHRQRLPLARARLQPIIYNRYTIAYSTYHII